MEREVPRWRPGNVPVPEASLAGAAVMAALDALRPWRLPGPSRLRLAVGTTTAAAGLALAAAAVRGSGRVDLARPDRLVDDGAFRACRNPMYVAWTLLQAGAGVARGTGWVLVTTPASAVVLHLEVLAEERRLANRFGADYATYVAAVPRYVPRLRRRVRRR